MVEMGIEPRCLIALGISSGTGVRTCACTEQKLLHTLRSPCASTEGEGGGGAILCERITGKGGVMVTGIHGGEL